MEKIDTRSIDRSSISRDYREFLLDVAEDINYENPRSSEDIISIILDRAKDYKLTCLGEGTNRIVLSDGGDTVLKLAHRNMGFIDNKYEKVISKLIDKRLVSGDRLAKSLTDNGLDTGYAIEQYREKCIKEIISTPSDGKYGIPSIKYIIKNIEEYTRMIRELEKDFILCDVHIRRPFNFGENSRGDMIVIDYGYFIPYEIISSDYKLKNGATVSDGRIRCSCGDDLEYHIPDVRDTERNSIERITNGDDSGEVYVCRSRHCGKKYACKDIHEELLDISIGDDGDRGRGRDRGRYRDDDRDYR